MQKIEQDYRRNVAIVEARPKLEQGLLFAWLLVDVALIAYFIVSVVLYLVAGSFTEVRSMATIAQNAGDLRDASLARAADPLVLGDVRVLVRDAGSYDVYATVENANNEWYVTFDYSFTDVDAAPQRATVMPGETAYVLALGIEAAARPSGAQLKIEHEVWTRVDRHTVPDTAEFLVAHSNFALSEAAYAVDVALEKDTVGRSVFTLTNNTAYSYYDPEFVVLLKRGGTVVGVNTVTVPKLKAGESREVSVHWFGTAPTSASVEAVPSINYFDEETYMDPEGESGD